MAFNILDSLNNNSKNVVEDKPSANFRTKDISIFNIYRNEKNFYQIVDIEELANSILLVGLMSNLVVVYQPNDKGQEYKLISGERRLEALKSLYNKGHKEYEYVTCQIKKEQSEEEEEIEIIIANSSRIKTNTEILQEEAKLKANLEKMKAEGKKLKGFDLDKGRLRDVIASILGVSKTKVAQIENINNNLHDNFRKELDEGNINFATANALAGMKSDEQQQIYEEKKENIKDLKLKDIKEIKNKDKKVFDPSKRYKFSIKKSEDYFKSNDIDADIEEYKKYEGIEALILSSTNAKVTSADGDSIFVNPHSCVELEKELEGQINATEVIENNILEKFETDKRYAFSFEAYKRYCKKYGEAVGGPEAHKYDWMEDLEGKEPEEFVTEVSVKIYTKAGYKYLRPYYFREMTKFEIEKKDEQIKNEKKLKRLEALRFEEGYVYKYSFAKKAEYKYLKDNVILTEKSKSNWDKENDGKEVTVINPRSAKLGDYRLNPWECVKCKEDIKETIECQEISDLREVDLGISDEKKEALIKILEFLESDDMTNIEKIKTFDVIYMTFFIWKMVLGNCERCPVKKCEYVHDATDIRCRKSIRNWLKSENTLEADYPKDATGTGEGETNE